MSINKTVIDDICIELRQLCTELEKIRAVSEENYSRDRMENPFEKTRSIESQEPQESKLKQEDQGRGYI